jgi:hypothetical protein
MIAQDDQNILDITLSQFGTLDHLFTLINDNGLTFNSKLSSGQELIINNSGVGNNNIKNFVILHKVSYNNNQGASVTPLDGGDFNIDFSNDFF